MFIVDKQDSANNLKPVLRVLALVELILLIFLAFTVVRYKEGRVEYLHSYAQPKIIEDAVTAISSADADYDAIISKYFAIEGTDSIDYVKTKLAFDYIFRPAGESCYGCEIVRSAPGYVELILKGKDGESLYPKVAFGYRLDESSTKIIDYSFARLQPFSRRHKEYDSRWSK